MKYTVDTYRPPPWIERTRQLLPAATKRSNLREKCSVAGTSLEEKEGWHHGWKESKQYVGDELTCRYKPGDLVKNRKRKKMVTHVCLAKDEPPESYSFDRKAVFHENKVKERFIAVRFDPVRSQKWGGKKKSAIKTDRLFFRCRPARVLRAYPLAFSRRKKKQPILVSLFLTIFPRRENSDRGEEKKERSTSCHDFGAHNEKRWNCVLARVAGNESGTHASIDQLGRA